MNTRPPTFTAVLPHAQVDVGDVIAAAVAVRQLSYPEDIVLDTCDVVSIVAQHAGQRGLFELGQLGRSEHTRVFVPEPEKETNLCLIGWECGVQYI